MRVLGIDPGYDRIGIAVLEGDRSHQELIHSECFSTNPKDLFDKRLHEVVSRTRILVKKYTPDVSALETLFFSVNQKTALHVAEVRGALMYALYDMNCPIYEYPPQYIKQAVTGYGSSSKDGMITMLDQLLKIPPGKRLDDEYDAIGIALTHLVTSQVTRNL